MELELKHLACYLPYGLNVINKRDWITEMTDISTDYMYSMQEVLNGEATPLLRPLDQLTQEIEHNGEKFVPIIKLAKMDKNLQNVDFQINEFGNCIGRLNAGVTVIFELKDEIPFVKEVHNNIFDQVSGNEFDDMYLSDLLPSEAREKLFELHYDVFNLIPQGLALPIK